MRFNPIGRQSKRQRKLLKEQLARIEPALKSEHQPLWSVVKASARTSRPPARFRRR